MDDRIGVYESLLNEVAALEKECEFLGYDYEREFGDEINQLFALKIEVIALKKKIAFCVRKQNRGEEIDPKKMQEKIDASMAGYEAELQAMIENKRKLDRARFERCSYDELRMIKTLYYRVAHLIHPDLRPDLASNQVIQELWLKAVDAYKRNDVKSIRMVFDQVLILVEDNCEALLDGIDEKIADIQKEIETIKAENPYQYKFILEDEQEVFKIHKEHREQEEYFLHYIDELSDELSKYVPVVKRRNVEKWEN